MVGDRRASLRADQPNLLLSEFHRRHDGEWTFVKGGDLVKAVRNAPPTVEVVDVDEPQGVGDLVRVVATGICASDLKYLQFGSTQIAGHEFAGVLEDGTAVAVEGFFGCGKCEQCGQGTYKCASEGRRRPGCLAQAA
jgi:threonine dehydrogenase-like Zn-dependent dehydrogenase